MARDEDLVHDQIKEMLEARLAGHNVYIWPTKSGEVPDKEPAFIVAYLPLEFASETKADKQTMARNILENYGDKPRSLTATASASPSRPRTRSKFSAARSAT